MLLKICLEKEFYLTSIKRKKVDLQFYLEKNLSLFFFLKKKNNLFSKFYLNRILPFNFFIFLTNYLVKWFLLTYLKIFQFKFYLQSITFIIKNIKKVFQLNFLFIREWFLFYKFMIFIIFIGKITSIKNDGNNFFFI